MARTGHPAEALVAEALRDIVSALEARNTELVAHLRGLALNDVLWSGLVVIPADGIFELAHFSVPMATIAVMHVAGDGPTTLAAAPRSGSAPSSGVGVKQLPAGGAITHPLTGTSLTIYGSPGALLDLAVFAKVVPPNHHVGGVDGGGP